VQVGDVMVEPVVPQGFGYVEVDAQLYGVDCMLDGDKNWRMIRLMKERGEMGADI
jgi:hypothetical protein